MYNENDVYVFSIDCGKRILTRFTWDLWERKNNAKVINILFILQIKYLRSLRFTTKANIYILRGTRLFCDVNRVLTRNHNTFEFRYRLFWALKLPQMCDTQHEKIARSRSSWVYDPSTHVSVDFKLPCKNIHKRFGRKFIYEHAYIIVMKKRANTCRDDVIRFKIVGCALTIWFCKR